MCVCSGSREGESERCDLRRVCVFVVSLNLRVELNVLYLWNEANPYSLH